MYKIICKNTLVNKLKMKECESKTCSYERTAKEEQLLIEDLKCPCCAQDLIEENYTYGYDVVTYYMVCGNPLCYDEISIEQMSEASDYI